MTKHSIQCFGYRPFPKNTLVGFVDVRVRELRLVVKDVALHQKGESRWAQLPARPQLRDGVHIPDPKTGKLAYVNLFQFEDRATSDAFSKAVWNACRQCMEAAAA